MSMLFRLCFLRRSRLHSPRCKEICSDMCLLFLLLGLLLLKQCGDRTFGTLLRPHPPFPLIQLVQLLSSCIYMCYCRLFKLSAVDLPGRNDPCHCVATTSYEKWISSCFHASQLDRSRGAKESVLERAVGFVSHPPNALGHSLPLIKTRLKNPRLQKRD
jgi:hypothetical protein